MQWIIKIAFSLDTILPKQPSIPMRAFSLNISLPTPKDVITFGKEIAMSKRKIKAKFEGAVIVGVTKQQVSQGQIWHTWI
jgi:hypothetical protein